MNHSIRNIIFDWGGVLIDLDVEGCIHAFEQAGINNVRQLLTGSNEAGFFHTYECGDISTTEFRDAIRRLSGKELSDESIDHAWNRELLTIPEEKLGLLSRLSQKYNLYLLSNTNELHWEYGSAHAFRYGDRDMKTCFRQIFLSYRMHLAKPNPEIFRAALQEASLQPEETLFIDDNEINCQAAASTGIHAMHYLPGTDLARLFQ